MYIVVLLYVLVVVNASTESLVLSFTTPSLRWVLGFTYSQCRRMQYVSTYSCVSRYFSATLYDKLHDFALEKHELYVTHLVFSGFLLKSTL